MKTIFKCFVVICLLLACWITADWYWPVKTDIRQFDPYATGRLDTEMWRSYYDGKKVKMFFELAELLRTQFKAPYWRSNIIAYDAAKAAFIFKNGRDRNDHEKALPSLNKYYSEIHRLSIKDFDIKQAARTELEWWIVHRDKRQYNTNDLQASLRKNAAALYSMPDRVFTQYAFYRTTAMKLRDEKQDRGDVDETDWRTIEADLQRSWNELHHAVSPKESAVQ